MIRAVEAAQQAMASQSTADTCYDFNFILFVTGRGEKEHLPKMFRALSASGLCGFEVKEFVPQRRGITSAQRIAEMVGSGKEIPDDDFARIGAPARRYVAQNPCHRLILIDDLEGINESEATAAFERYRKALDSGLGAHKALASVHFPVNMLEACFFADPNALNGALNPSPPVGPHQ